MNQKDKKFRAFTLMELILVTALISFSLAIVSPIYFSAKNKNDLRDSADILVSSLRQAQISSIAINDDSSWGVKIKNKEIIVFKGESYSSRNENRDISFSVSKSISFNGEDEIIFNKFYGKPSFSGDIYITSQEGQTLSININSLGLASY